MPDDLLDPRLTEQRNARTRDIDTADPLEIVDLINDEDRSVPDAVRAERRPIAQAIEIAVKCFKEGGRLIYVGAGTSGRLGVLDAAECPPTFGTDPDIVQGIIAGGYMALVRSQEGAEDRAEEGAAAMDDRSVGPADFVLGIAASSTTPFVRRALERAAERGARTGFLCCTEPEPEIRESVDVCIVPLVGPEVITGSTRMKAGSATKLVLNTISTGAMVRLGKVYQNLMVDLQASSQKLVDRGERILMALTGCDRGGARQAIEETEGSVKLALLMEKARIGRALAELVLHDADGRVREALERVEAVRDSEDPFGPHPPSPRDDEALERVIRGISALPGAVSDLVRSVPAEDLERRPQPDAWSVKEVIEHLITFDGVIERRIRAIFAEDDPELPNWDEEIENARISETSAREADIDGLLRRLADHRASLVARVQAQPIEGFDRVGSHELWGEITIHQLLRHLLWHDDHHLRAIDRLLAD